LLASFAVEAVASLAGVPCLKLAFLLLLGSLLLPTLLLLLAFLLLLVCHKLVSDTCLTAWLMATSTATIFSEDIHLVKLAHFWKAI
jgi:hypothetical protein